MNYAEEFHSAVSQSLEVFTGSEWPSMLGRANVQERNSHFPRMRNFLKRRTRQKNVSWGEGIVTSAKCGSVFRTLQPLDYVASEWDTLDADVEPVWPTSADPDCVSTMTLHWDPRDDVLVKGHWCLPQGCSWARYKQFLTLLFSLCEVYSCVFILVCTHVQADARVHVCMYMWRLKAGVRWLSVLLSFLREALSLNVELLSFPGLGCTPHWFLYGTGGWLQDLFLTGWVAPQPLPKARSSPDPVSLSSAS